MAQPNVEHNFLHCTYLEISNTPAKLLMHKEEMEKWTFRDLMNYYSHLVNCQISQKLYSRVFSDF